MRIRSALAAAALLPGALAAQTVVVRATDQATRGPLGGALVSLESEAGKKVARALADERGRGVVTAPTPGRYRLRVDAIGYQGRSSEPFALGAGITVERAVELESAPLNLDEIVVASARPAQCSIDEAEGTIAARLWDEARKALTGTAITRTSRATELEIRTFERRLDFRARVVGEKSETRRGPSNRPFIAADADSLHRFGYIQSRFDGTWFHAPDAELLLGEEFLGDHCFRPTAVDPTTAGRIGLDFEPTRARPVPDVRGTLWMDPKSLELRAMEFGYTGYDMPFGTTGVGGKLEFLKLPNGGWIITRWEIRMPVIGSRRLMSGRADSLMGYREAGGTAVPTSLAAVSSRRTGVTGIVFDSLLGHPLAGARVSMEEGARAGITDASGRFLIESPGTGDYVLTVEHPVLALRGLDPIRAAARLVRGQLDTTDVGLEGPGALLKRLCGADRFDPRLGLLLVGAVDSAGALVPAATIRVRSPRPYLIPSGRGGGRGQAAPPRLSVGAFGSEWETMQADGKGAVMCGLPRGAELQVTAAIPGGIGRTLRLEPDSAAVREVLLRHPD